MTDDVNAPSTKTGKVGGPPEGNQNRLTHGVFSLEAKRKRGQIDRRTSPYRAMKKIERQIRNDPVEKQKRWREWKASRLEYYCQKIDAHLATLKNVVYKGRVNPAVELFLRLSDSVDVQYVSYSSLLANNKPPDLARRFMREGKP